MFINKNSDGLRIDMNIDIDWLYNILNGKDDLQLGTYQLPLNTIIEKRNNSNNNAMVLCLKVFLQQLRHLMIQ